ncbi:unnamed protein product [Oncorhynchus mykiss]|uniref:CCHC-type domain-containing protein n=1 Tax=Oncorhynchus mykiss TaxID=8022 RepID=A0A060YR86_ONCMY|nr:unnamed protein product [Oncorhynchus mykiss]
MRRNQTFLWSRQRREQEDRAEGRRDWAEGGREHRQGEYWRRQEEKRCCFLCGSHAHIKKDCPQYRGPAGAFSSSPSTSHMRNLRERKTGGKKEKEATPKYD